jgi:hypothetical protein
MPRDIQEILSRHTARLMAMPGVVGVGAGGSAAAPAVVVMVRTLTPALRRALPKTLDGVPVTVEESGDITAS